MMNNRKMDTEKSQTLATNIEIPKLARYLREKGIQARNTPGLILKKAADLYIAILCMLKSGIAYLSIIVTRLNNATTHEIQSGF
jgi:non-ribosomal peptide synthetase component E (peptide arylation enzyme)